MTELQVNSHSVRSGVLTVHVLQDAGACSHIIDQPPVQEEDDEEEDQEGDEWTVQQASRPRRPRVKEPEGWSQSRSGSLPPGPRSSVKP